jgi:diguanylate cyclase (GGDEF)-like protein
VKQRVDTDGFPSSPPGLQERQSVAGRWLARATQSHILFPAIALIALALIWGFTLRIIKVERAAAERTAEVASHQLAETYEAQMVRALREIDEALKVVKYAHDVENGNGDILQRLRARDLLPPELLFEIMVTDSRGNVVASNRPSDVTNVADLQVFQRQRQADDFMVSRPHRSSISGTWWLDFSRRLGKPDGSFAGIVMLSVNAAYFVSGYEPSQLGKHGMLGLIGTDGIFRVRRSGDAISAGGQTDFGALHLHTDSETEVESELAVNAWDGVRRFTSTRRIYAYPLAVVVGLSADEQLEGFRKNRRTYLWRASAGSGLMVVVLVLMGYMARQLELSRLRVLEEQAAYAARVEYLAYHDGLTGLANRSLFSKLLDQSIRQAQRYKRQLAILFFDLDHFKEINDTLGHDAGDLLLQEMATRLGTCLRVSDTVARMGGDEFVVLMPELNEEQCIEIVARKILAAVARPFVLQGREYFVTASIGISVYPQDGLDEQTLSKNADIAMYRVKEQGRNAFQFYSGPPQNS